MAIKFTIGTIVYYLSFIGGHADKHNSDCYRIAESTIFDIDPIKDKFLIEYTDGSREWVDTDDIYPTYEDADRDLSQICY